MVKIVHSGRCCPISEFDEKPDCASKEQDYWVLANYDRFKGGRKANVEVHGGATLEEALVPIILIELDDKSSKPEIINRTPNPEYTFDKDPAVILFCPFKVDRLNLRIEEKLFMADKISETEYQVILLGFGKKERTIKADCYEGDNYLTSFELKITKASKAARANDDFDDFFS